MKVLLSLSAARVDRADQKTSASDNCAKVRTCGHPSKSRGDRCGGWEEEESILGPANASQVGEGIRASRDRPV